MDLSPFPFLAWSDARGGNGVLRQIDGCTPAGEGRDVIWQGGDLYVATAPNKLQRIWTTEEPGCAFGPHPSYICFDGRYVWAPLTRAAGCPSLIVVDPQTAQAWEYPYGVDDARHSGVPPCVASAAQEYRLGVAPLSAGKVCVVIRSWQPPVAGGNPVGPATRAPAGADAATKVWFGTFEFIAADQAAVAEIPIDSALDLAVGPAEMLTLAVAERRAVIVGRGAHYPQLIVDPEARQVKPAASIIAERPGLTSLVVGRFAVHDGAVWYMTSIRSLNTGPNPAAAANLTGMIFGRPALARAALPELKEEVVLREVPVGLVVSSQGSLQIIGERCWRLRDTGPELEAIAVEPPWQFDDYLNSSAILTTGKLR